MKELFVGLSTIFTAATAIVTAVFEFALRDVKDLREDFKKKDRELGAFAAEQKALSKRRSQKLWLLFPLLILAFGCGIAGLVISSPNDSRPPPPRLHLQQP